MLVNPHILLIALLVMLVISPLLAVMVGSASLEFDSVLAAFRSLLLGIGPSNLAERIVIELRLPRVLMALICGAGLALCGWVLQSITRNPLADPYLFGISSGSSLGAVLALSFGFVGVGLSFSAFIGALVAVALVMIMARDGRIERLILAGVAISFLMGSLASLLLYFSDPQAIQAVLFWTMGSFARAHWPDLWFPSVVLTLTLTLVLQQQRALQALMIGDESAHTQGIAVQPLRLGMLLLTALLTASLVAKCGGIGFVGLMVPHVVRLLIGGGDQLAVLISTLLGALLMVWVDLLARWLMPDQELPVGVITAILGSIFFLTLLLQHKER